MERTYTKIRSKENIENKSGVNVKCFEKGNKDVIITDVAIRNYQIGGYTKKDKNHYLDVRDNMIKTYNHNLVRSEKSIKRSMSTLRDFLHNYFTGDKNEVFVTLTTSYLCYDDVIYGAKVEVKDIDNIDNVVSIVENEYSLTPYAIDVEGNEISLYDYIK